MDYTQFVDTNIGTIGHLLQSTAPNVQSPHGAAIVAPVFRPGMKDRYLSDRIFGFTVGGSILMPFAGVDAPDFYHTASSFDHDFEVARPDHYEVLLEDFDITERHTAMANYGAFQLSRPSGAMEAVVYTPGCTDCRYEDGFLTMTGLAERGNAPMTALFALEGVSDVTFFDALIPEGESDIPTAPTRAARIRFSGSEARLSFVLSMLGADSAMACYRSRVAGKSFQDIQAECNRAWNDVLGKVRVQGGTPQRLRAFYTALYRATCRMHDYSVEGRYLGFDGAVHDDGGQGFYCDDGIWDTYRGMHPLQLLLEPEVHQSCLTSYLRMYEQSGWLPRFPFPGGNVPCMIGHHTVSILAESMEKGVDFDWALAYEAAHKNATRRTMLPWRDGEAEELTRCYYEKGFFPALDEDAPETNAAVHEFENRQAVAVTIEHGYDDWCLSRMAERLGKAEDAAFFRARSERYRQLYDPEIGFFRPRRADGSFVSPFNPKYCGGQGGRKYFAENNAYIYSFAAQHDVPGLIALMGGEAAFSQRLDQLFVEQYDGQLKSHFLAQYPDATGLMGQFCMGNEPSFHIPYLYNYCGHPEKTQRRIHELIDLWFPDTPLGVCGDEDGGAMSAWLAFSAMGFYPVNPASGWYDLGSPIFDRVEIDLPNGRTFAIDAQGASGRAKYIRSAHIGGEALAAPRFSHEQMLRGETLTLEMSERPCGWNAGI